MDNIFDRAHDIIDKAQGKVASAASQAAWAANQGLLIRNLEGQVQALQEEIERVTREIGERTYAAWRAHADDPRIPGLCGHLNDLYGRRDRASADLAAARAATYDPRVYQVMPPLQQLPAGAQPQLPASVQAPSIVPPRPVSAITPNQQPPTPITVDARAPMTPPPAQGRPAPAAPRQTTAPQAPASQAPAPMLERQARECPNCGQFVAGGVDFCPMCGIRVI